MERDGSFRTVELFGPQAFPLWKGSYKVLCTICISHDVVDKANLKAYRLKLHELLTMFGEDSITKELWVLLYQADTRARAERMDAIRWELVQEHAVAKLQGMAHPLDPKRPWNAVWKRMAEDREFWRREFEIPALQVVLKRATLGQVVTGEASIQPLADTVRISRARPAMEVIERPSKKKKNAKGRSLNIPKDACQNCGRKNHTTENCFREGGAKHVPGGKGSGKAAPWA